MASLMYQQGIPLDLATRVPVSWLKTKLEVAPGIILATLNPELLLDLWYRPGRAFHFSFPPLA